MTEPAGLTSLVLRNVAEHLAAGEAMTVTGEWSRDLFDARRPSGRRAARQWDAGRHAALADAIRALLWIADRNDPPPSTPSEGAPR